MKRWSITLALAIAGAVAAPLVAGTWQLRANAQLWTPLTTKHRTEIVAMLENSKNCRYFETQIEVRDVLGLDIDSKDIDDAMQCHRDQDALRDGGEMRASFSLPRYLAVNGAIALASAFGVLGLAITLPALFRRTRWRLGS